MVYALKYDNEIFKKSCKEMFKFSKVEPTVIPLVYGITEFDRYFTKPDYDIVRQYKQGIYTKNPGRLIRDLIFYASCLRFVENNTKWTKDIFNWSRPYRVRWYTYYAKNLREIEAINANLSKRGAVKLEFKVPEFNIIDDNVICDWDYLLGPRTTYTDDVLDLIFKRSKLKPKDAAD